MFGRRGRAISARPMCCAPGTRGWRRRRCCSIWRRDLSRSGLRGGCSASWGLRPPDPYRWRRSVRCWGIVSRSGWGSGAGRAWRPMRASASASPGRWGWPTRWSGWRCWRWSASVRWPECAPWLPPPSLRRCWASARSCRCWSIIAVLIIWLHRANVRRLLRRPGTEGGQQDVSDALSQAPLSQAPCLRRKHSPASACYARRISALSLTRSCWRVSAMR